MQAARLADSTRSVIVDRLAEMTVTAEVLSGTSDLNEILQRVGARARELTRADFAAISTFDDKGKLERFVYTGIDEGTARRLGHPPIGRGLLGELASRDRPLRLEDLREHESFTGWPEGHPDMTGFLGVPIRAAGRTIGSLYMTRVHGEPFTELDELRAATLSLQAAVSVSSALARERAGRMFLLEERERIAHDLHDGTIQTLYALGLELDAMANGKSFPAEVRTSLTAGVERINQLIADIRAYIVLLEAEAPRAQPELSRDLAFVIRQIVPPGTDTVVNITAAALQELSARDSEDLLYIAREALSNAVRHGAASKIAIDLRQSSTETALTIQDNGVGFDSENVRTGLGSITMRTRAERLGGTLSILGIPGMGTTVRVAIPRDREREAADYE
jgi:signal transduction histidine kinase